jgi:hypothetical protein
MIAGTKGSQLLLSNKRLKTKSGYRDHLRYGHRLIAKKCFPNATRVTDRFHVQKQP